MTRRHLLLSATIFAGVGRATVPTRQAKPERMFDSPGGHPNGLQATADGLWILDQGDNHAYLVSWKKGKLLRSLETESDRGSGIGFDGSAIWIASTYNCKTIKADPKTGKTLAVFETPGCGQVSWGDNPNRPRTGAHGIEFKDGKMWIAVPPSETIYRLDPATQKVEHQIPAPGHRPHGISFQGDWLWCTESNHMAFYRLDPKTGEQTAKLELAKDAPTPHGMSIWDGAIWYSDADGTGAIYRVPLPSL
ncbi:MAG: hypothetical protein GC160_19055 [Acidobacteria bacterium]|nr:hypothetical protein [Acidobacteriota bacterium]